MTAIFKRLAELDIVLPAPASPVAAYVPFVTIGNTVFISGQLPMENGRLAFTGKLGDDVALAQGQHAARLCGLNILAHLAKACDGDLDRVQQCAKLGGFVNCTPTFLDHPKVVNGASELMQAVFGIKGQHARSAVGVPSLPLNAAVEVDAIFSIRA